MEKAKIASLRGSSTNLYWIISMVLAPALLVVAQFFWKNGILSSTSGTIQVYSFFFWILAFRGMWSPVRERFPKISEIGFIISIFACMGGSHFGMDGIYGETIGITDEASKNAIHQTMMPELIFAMYLPGLLFPLIIMGTGIVLRVSKIIPASVCVIVILSAIGFPLSRIPRIDWIAHLDNLALFLSQILILIHIKKWESENLN